MILKILMVSGSYPPLKCGVGDYTHNLVESLTNVPDVSVSVLTSYGVEEPTDTQGCIHRVVNGWGLGGLFSFIKIIHRYSPDIVHIQYPTQGYGQGFLPFFLPLISMVMGCKVVQTWHEIYRLRHCNKFLLKAAVKGSLIVVRPHYVEGLNPLFRFILRNKNVEFIKNASAIPRNNLSDSARNVLRQKYLNGNDRLIVFFGFVYPHKGAELLFEIADIDKDQIVIAGELPKEGDYVEKINNRATVGPWSRSVTITGFLSENDSAELLAVADAVVLPFRIGGGEWNSSIHAAVLQGTFVITTSGSKRGYDPKSNTYYAKVDDIRDMKSALSDYAGTRRDYDSGIDRDEWEYVASEHLSLYKSILNIS